MAKGELWVGALYRRRRRRKNGTSYTEVKWRFDYRLAGGKRGSLPCCADKYEAEAMRGDFIDKVRRGDDPLAERRSRAGAKHRSKSLTDHLADFLRHLAADGASEAYRTDVRQHLTRFFAATGAPRPDDLTKTVVEGFLLALVQEHGRAYATRNHYRDQLCQFLDWMVGEGRCAANPVASIKRLSVARDPRNTSTDPAVVAARRDRRALTAAELHALVAAARARPLACYIAGNHPNPAPEKIAELELLGVQRAALYLTAALVGLRRGELRGLRWADLDLDGEPPTATPRAATTKAGRADTVCVPAQAADALREWWAARATAQWAKPKPEDLVFDCIGRQCIDRFRADCRYAGIELRTAEGRVDFHSLRHTCGTLHARAGVAARTVQAQMRHASLTTTQRYLHSTSADRREAAERVDAFLDAATGDRRAARQ